MAIADSHPAPWRDDEKDYREREVKSEEANAETQATTAKSQGRSITVQTLALLFAAVATASAAWGAWQATGAIDIAQQNSVSQGIEDQLATAISAIGRQSATAQVAGLTLLRRDIGYQVRLAVNGSADRQDAYDAYATSLEVIAVYLRSSTVISKNPQINSVYAADELKMLLGMSQQVEAISNGQRPAIDLSSVGLSGMSWPGINFGWLDAAFMPEIDLDGANLVSTSWGNATLWHADLRCADLQGADLRQADLRWANLRGANLSRAQLPPDAKLEGVKTDGIFGAPPGLLVTRPASSWSFASCKF